MARGSGGESKRELDPINASSSTSSTPLPLRYNHTGAGGGGYQSLQTATSTAAGDDPTVSVFVPASSSSTSGGGLFGLAARRGLLLHGGALVAAGLLCGLGVGVLIGRGGANGAASSLLSVQGGGEGWPVIWNAYSPQVRSKV